MADTDEQIPLWAPSTERVGAARMTHFMAWAGERHGRRFADYDELWRWSVAEIERFWADIWEYGGVRASSPYEQVLDSRAMPGVRWFAGARLNYAENLLCRELDAPGLRDEVDDPPGPGPVAGDASTGATPADGPANAALKGHALSAAGDGSAAAAPVGHSDAAKALGSRGDRIAVVHASELRPQSELSWGELSAQVAAVAEGMRSLGVQRGDRVAAYMPNIPETLIAFLACACIGAVWSCAAPEFGARSVIDRFAQIEPKLLLAIDGYRHGGKDFDRGEELAAILAGLPSVAHTVVLPYLSADATAAGLPGGLTWRELCARGAGADQRFEQVPFDHPLWVLYSSGTTGLPKAIVHGHGGILLEQLKKSLLHLDLHPGERMFWFTTTGWMMWNFLVGCLFAEATIVLYDGSPAHPDLGRLWRLAQDAKITCMGISAGLLSASEKAGIDPRSEYDLSALRAIGSTGSPLPPEGFHWVYEHVDPDVWLFSTSGGTDVCTAFVGGCPLLPVYAGELQCRVLGCAVESFDEHARSLTDVVGELVLTQPLPSMPVFFWGDPPANPSVPSPADRPAGQPADPLAAPSAGRPTGPADLATGAPSEPANPPAATSVNPARADRSDAVGERYRESYFDMYPGVWRHGDWIRVTPRGGAVIYGRSDSTINRQGVRMGTSEIYRATGAVPEVTDALVVDVPGPDGELQMVLFVVLREGVRLDDQLRVRIKRRVREYCSPRHVPNKVLQIEEVPRTLSGKALEVPIKRILMGAAPAEAASVESLANPRSLDYFVDLARRCRGKGRATAAS